MKRVTFTIGQGKDKEGNSLSNTMDLLAARRVAYDRIAEAFGGYTAYLAEGGWVENGQLIQEISLVVSVVTNDSWYDIAAWLRDLFNQQCVLVTVEPVKSHLV